MKEAYYFSHDSNARHDPKITAMRGVYGSEGYGWYWMLIEMMRESEGYKLDMHSKYAFNAFALQLQADSKKLEGFVNDCIHEFNLFDADDTHFWSASLLRRMNIREQKSEARRKAAKARWDKEKQPKETEEENARNMQMHSNGNANAMQGKESKGKESKRNKSKENKKDKTAFEDYTSNPTLIKTLESYLEHRKKIKKPMTDNAIKLLLGNLDKLASNDTDKIAILEQSIFNGWQGVFPLKNDLNSYKQSSKSHKSEIPIVKPSQEDSVSDEEFAEMLKLAESMQAGKGNESHAGDG